MDVLPDRFLACRLPIWHDVCDDAKLWKKALADIVKTRDGSQRTPLMRGIGAASFVNDISEAELLAAVEVLKKQAQTHPVSFMHMAEEDVSAMPSVLESTPYDAPQTPGMRKVPALMA